MLKISGTDEERSNNNKTPIIHYRFKRKIEYLNCHIQLYISNEKIKIIINCIEEYSDEFKEYSNNFSLFQFQELNEYFNYFKKIEDILEDMSNIFQLNSYDIEKNQNTLTIILHVVIDNEFDDVYITLFRNKLTNNHTHKIPAQTTNNVKSIDNRKKLISKPHKNNIEKNNSRMVEGVGDYPLGVKNIKELNNLLTDLKDRITVLEVNHNTNNQSQNRQYAPKNNYNNITYPEKVLSLGSTSLVGNEKILLNMDSILKRINKLEEANTLKKQKIKYLEEKLKVYEPMLTTSENESLNNYNNNYNLNNNYINNNYIDLGSIKNKDMNTIYSNNTNKNNNLVEIKEEEQLNSSSSSKDKSRRRSRSRSRSKNKNKNKNRDKSARNKKPHNIYNKDNNIYESEKKDTHKYKEKEKDKNKDKDIERRDKSRSKNKHKKESHTPTPKMRKNNKYNNKDNNEDNNEENYKNNRSRKNSERKSKTKDKDKKNKNLKEEFIRTDIRKNKDKSNKKIKIINEYDENESERVIKNLEKNLKKYKEMRKPNIKYTSNEKNKNNNHISFSLNKDNNENIDTNNIKYINNIDNNININPYNNNITTNKYNYTKNNSIDNIENINNINNIRYANDINNQKYNNEYMKNQNESIIKNNIKEKYDIQSNEIIKETSEKESKENSYEIKKNENNKNILKKLPIVEKENIKKYVNSEIIFTKNELKLLKTKINGGDKNIHVFFDILYRATEDGDNTNVIKKIIKDKSKTLTLFYTEEHARFGIYIEKEISYSIFGKSLKEKKGTSFLVSLNNLDIYDILEDKTATENKSDILCFIKNKVKNKNGSGWAIFTPQKQFLGKECIIGEMKNIFGVEYLENIIGEKYEYHLKEVEIFEVAIEKEEEKEGRKESSQGVDKIINNKNVQQKTYRNENSNNLNINLNTKDNKENKQINNTYNSNKDNNNSIHSNNINNNNNMNKDNNYNSINNNNEVNNKNNNKDNYFNISGIIEGTKNK